MPSHADSPPKGSDILKAWAEREGGPALPVLPETPSEAGAESDRTRALRLRLRRFCAGEPHEAEGLDTPGPDLLPALMLPFRDPERVRHDYPLLLSGQDGHGAAPLSAALVDLAGRFAPGPDDARILKDNFARLERCVRESLDGTAAPVEAMPLIRRAARMTEDTLGLKGAGGEQLHDALEQLVTAVPAGDALLPLGEHTALQLLLHAAVRHAAERRTALESEVTGLRDRLRDRLRLDDACRAGADDPETLSGTMGDVAGAHLDSEALARIVGTARGTAPMAADRRAGIDEAIATLQRFLGGGEKPPVLVVHHDDVPAACRVGDAEWRQIARHEVCGRAAAMYDELTAEFATLFAAMRLARLELEGADPTRHDTLREALDWRAFSRDELRSLPPVIALESADHLAGAGMLGLSRLLRSGRTVNVLVTVEPASNPGVDPDDDPLASFRFELGYLGVSHREALVNQSSAARPHHLLAGIRRGLQATRAALHVVASGLTADGEVPALGGWLHAGAALEGRAHPLYHYDPEAGETWARRLDFSENPEPEMDWPVHTLPCRRHDGTREGLDLAFTFADFALMEPGYRQHFRIVPPDVTGDEFMTLEAYLTLPPDETRGRVAFIWAADDGGGLHRLAVDRQLAFACRERLDYWRTLQELAGVRSEYVREALERQRGELESAFGEQTSRLAEQHAAELEAAREQASGDAMRRLAEALLATDISTLAASPPAATPPAEPAPTPEAAPAAEAPKPVAEAEPAPPETPESEEPWIDTVLCTSCNDCMAINSRVFVYDANKQAIIGDATAGTYDEMVRAAEICPAHCIHPGLPLNPDEPNLDALIERARPFNV